MIIDACIYAGESEMFEFRRTILEPFVDMFIVSENAFTCQGQKRERSSDSNGKIISIYSEFISDDPMTIETHQRQAIADYCCHFKSSDIIIFSDIDEIPSRESMTEAIASPLPVTCNLDFFYYRLNHKRPETCSIVITTVRHLIEIGGQAMRDLRGTPPHLANRGWHLSYFGGTKAIQNKLRSFSHAEFNKEEFLNDEWLEHCQLEGKGLLKCITPFTKVDATHFPEYFINAAPKGWWL